MTTVVFSTSILVRNSFTALHRWKDCPHEEVAFLREWHRHVFKVRTAFSVKHNNRDLEFFLVQKKVQNILDQWEGRMLDMSCEMFADAIVQELLMDGLPVCFCAVSEDGENEASLAVLEVKEEGEATS